MRRGFRKSVVVSFILACLISVSTLQPYTTRAQDKDPKAALCAVPTESVGGSAYARATGAGGGVSSIITPDQQTNPDWVIQFFKSMQPNSQNPRKNVLLVIADDFQTKDQSGHIHGQEVEDVANAVLDMLVANGLPKGLIKIETKDIGPQFTTEFIVQQLHSILDEYKAGTSQHTGLVLNFSFVLVSCGPEFKTFLHTYLREGAKEGVSFVNVVGDEKKAEQLLTDPSLDNPLDPLHAYVQSLIASRQFEYVVPVAAAGNFGTDKEAFFPGKWKEVVSVGGSVGQSLTKEWQASNLGEVMVPAAWYPAGKNSAGVPEFIAGTSFASPALSVLLAAYIAVGKQKCARKFEFLEDRAFDNAPFDKLINKGFC